MTATSMGTQILAIPSAPTWSLPDNVHTLLAGASGTGKSGAMMLRGRVHLRNPGAGFQCIDPEGELSNHFIEFCANPENGAAGRIVHHLRPVSPTHSFGLPMLQAPRDDLQTCHDNAVRLTTILAQCLGFAADQSGFGPRILKLLHLGCFGLGLNGHPFVALPELYVSATHLRQSIGDTLPYRFMTEEWRALDVLSERNPQRFQEYTESLMSRLLPILGSPIMRRAFGQTPALDIKRMLDNREVVLLDLGGLESKDAILIGTSYFSLMYHEALRRPLGAASVQFFADEIADYLTPDLARGFDRLRKRSVYLTVACQRFAQFVKPHDPAASALSAVLTNCRAKIIFGGLAPEDAELLARLVFTGALDLDTVYKPGSVRPVAVGSRLVTLTGRAMARHHAEQSAVSSGEVHNTSRMRSVANATMWASGSAALSGTSSSFQSMPDASLMMSPALLSQGSGRSAARNDSASAGGSRARMAGEQSGHGVTTQRSSGSADGMSVAQSEHQAFVTDYAELPTESFTLEEKIHSATGTLMNLEPRHCIVKVQGQAPFRTRTSDLTPAFRSARFKDLMLPRYLDRLVRTSPYLRPVSEVDAAIAAALDALTARPAVVEPDFTAAEPAPPARQASRLRMVRGNRNPPTED